MPSGPVARAGPSSVPEEMTLTTYLYDQTGRRISRQPHIALAPSQSVFPELDRLEPRALIHATATARAR